MPQNPNETRQKTRGVSLKPSLAGAIAQFGKDAKAKLSHPPVTGEPEDQLRAPFEKLVRDMAALCGLAPDAVVIVGETAIAALHTRPDCANWSLPQIKARAALSATDPRAREAGGF